MKKVIVGLFMCMFLIGLVSAVGDMANGGVVVSRMCGNGVCDAGEGDEAGGCGENADQDCLGPPARRGTCSGDCPSGQALGGRGETNVTRLGDKIIKPGRFHVYEDIMEIEVPEKGLNKKRLRVKNVSVDCECNITQERFQNKTKLKVKLKNGRNAEIKVMPNTASETALRRLRLKNCVEAEGCRIELKEVGKGNKSRLAYEMKTQKKAKVFGLFKARMNVRAQVDAETGEIVRVNKPWWAFLASESDEEVEEMEDLEDAS